MGRYRTNPFLWLAVAVLLVALILPIGAMLARSMLFYEVVQKDGTVERAVGELVFTELEVRYSVASDDPEDPTPSQVDLEYLAETRRVWSLDNYRSVFTEERTGRLLLNSGLIAFGGALLALLLGLPMAWIIARTRMRGRMVFAALCLGPAVLPPFFIALGGARQMQAVLIALFDVSGPTLQILNSMLVFGCVLFPVYVLLVGPAMAAVPAGPWEAARLLRGPRAAFRHVTLPAVLPAVVGAFVLVFVLALADFAIPDVLGFMLPAGGSTANVFATEMFMQWTKHGNVGRAVATAAPIVLLTLGLLLVALAMLRRSPVFAAARGQRVRPPCDPRPRRKVVAYLFVAAVLGVSLVMPMAKIATWGGAGAESVTGGSFNPQATDTSGVALFDFSTTLDKTTGSREERDRWLLTAFLAALLSMTIAVPMARAASRAGRGARALVVLMGALPLAIPGTVLAVGTLLLWQAIPGLWLRPLESSILRSVLILAVKFLPFALVAAWLALRSVRRGHEEAAAMLGAGGLTRAWRVIRPQALWGLVAGGLMVFVLALRELDSVALIDLRILPIRLYDQIHRSRMGLEANLLFLCQAYLLGPALLAALVLGLKRRKPGV